MTSKFIRIYYHLEWGGKKAKLCQTRLESDFVEFSVFLLELVRNRGTGCLPNQYREEDPSRYHFFVIIIFLIVFNFFKGCLTHSFSLCIIMLYFYPTDPYSPIDHLDRVDFANLKGFKSNFWYTLYILFIYQDFNYNITRVYHETMNIS